jgi:hypothetical protein
MFTLIQTVALRDLESLLSRRLKTPVTPLLNSMATIGKAELSKSAKIAMLALPVASGVGVALVGQASVVVVDLVDEEALEAAVDTAADMVAGVHSVVEAMELVLVRELVLVLVLVLVLAEGGPASSLQLRTHSPTLLPLVESGVPSSTFETSAHLHYCDRYRANSFSATLVHE